MFICSSVDRQLGHFHLLTVVSNAVVNMVHNYLFGSLPSLLLSVSLLLTAKSLQSCPILCDPTDGSPTGSPVPGILQARTLEWVAISFSNAWKWKVKVKSLSRVRLLATPWTAAHQAPPSECISRSGITISHCNSTELFEELPNCHLKKKKFL